MLPWLGSALEIGAQEPRGRRLTDESHAELGGEKSMLEGWVLEA
jgi:hypothetical protein